MTSVLKSANLFPFGQLWRIGGDPDVNHVCGGITSVVILTIIVILSLLKVIEVFQMKTVSASSTRVNELIPPFIDITTTQNSQTIRPTMFAFSLDTGLQPIRTTSLTDTDITVTAFQYFEDNSNSTTIVNRVPIVLQPCTIEHISTVIGASQQFTEWGLNKFTCISLNQNYTIGGSRGFTTTFRALQFTFQCASTTCSNANNTNLAFTMLALSTEVNPTNASIPTQIYATPYKVVFQPSTNRQYFLELDQNAVSTDTSLMPWQSVETSKSVRAVDQLNQVLFGNTITRTTVWIQNSGTTNTFERIFLKLEEAVAFTGGIFQSLLGLFIFMAGFGQLVYEMRFMTEYFRIREPDQITFFSYLKLTAYEYLGMVNINPEWQNTKKQLQWQQTVNRLLDVVYLQRRIQFLERAMTVVLQKHQLKGLLLVEPPSPQESDKHYKDHQLRSRLIAYLKDKRKHDIQNKPQYCQQQNQDVSKNHRQHENLKRSRKQSATQLVPKDPIFEDYSEWSEDLEIFKDLQQGQMDKQSLIADLVLQIKKLIQESQQRNGDPRSRQILQKIDPRLIRKAKEIINEAEHDFRIQAQPIGP